MAVDFVYWFDDQPTHEYTGHHHQEHTKIAQNVEHPHHFDQLMCNSVFSLFKYLPYAVPNIVHVVDTQFILDQQWVLHELFLCQFGCILQVAIQRLNQ